MMYKILDTKEMQWLNCKGRSMWYSRRQRISGNENDKIVRGQSFHDHKLWSTVKVTFYTGSP